MLTEKDEVPLWTFDATDTDQILARALQPGGRNEVIVKAKRKLVAGTYETTLSFGALNVDPAKQVTTKVTFIVRKHPSIAIMILVAAVLFSYATSKGLARTLRQPEIWGTSLAKNLTRKVYCGNVLISWFRCKLRCFSVGGSDGYSFFVVPSLPGGSSLAVGSSCFSESLPVLILWR